MFPTIISIFHQFLFSLANGIIVGGCFSERKTMQLEFPQWLVSESIDFYVKLATALLFVVLVAAWRKRRKGTMPPGPFSLPIIDNIHMLGVLL
jgi:hypothetical protein